MNAEFQSRAKGRGEREWKKTQPRKAASAPARKGSAPRKPPTVNPASLTFPPQLPVSERREEIQKLFTNNQVIIVAGETGSGKTTQLAKIALASGCCAIAHTQPRRIAARSVAERIAEEINTPLGSIVGYQVRFEERISKHTRIRLMTDGILLNQIHHDPLLRAYDTIIIDEAHERSLNIDFLLGYIRYLLPKRPDLKVIITSATIDPLSFSEYFHNAPIIEVSGRSFPVEILYRPLEEDREDSSKTNPEHEESKDSLFDLFAPQQWGTKPQEDTGKTFSSRNTSKQQDLYEHIFQVAREMFRRQRGDILVFLSGEAEIRDAIEHIQGRITQGGNTLFRNMQLLPLYGRLPSHQQQAIFHPSPGKYRMIFTTNIAETSVTVPGIIHVIDSGFARISRYSHRSKTQRLPIEPISQASAKQRSGRAGRTAPGFAARLYSERDFESRPEFTDPEIRRTALASVILKMLDLNLGSPARFHFLTPPEERGVRAGYALLREIGAIANDRITSAGRKIARLPIEPRYARMLLEGVRGKYPYETVVAIAGMCIMDPREFPDEEREKAKEMHNRFFDRRGDIAALLWLWNYLEMNRDSLSRGAFRKLCRTEYLNYMRVREWKDLIQQLCALIEEIEPHLGKIRPKEPVSKQIAPLSAISPSDACMAAVHRAVLSGSLSHLGVRAQQTGANEARKRGRGRTIQEYEGSHGKRFALHPGSFLARSQPEAVLSVDLVETSRLFGRMNAVVDLSQAEQFAKEGVQRSHGEPQWDRTRAEAYAYERVSLYGVPIVHKRRILLRRIEPSLARSMFIRHALVEGEWEKHYPFEAKNTQLREQIRRAEELARKRSVFENEDDIYDFFDLRLPHNIFCGQDFEAWWAKDRKAHTALLTMREEDLVHTASGKPITKDTEDSYPSQLNIGPHTFALTYRYEPGSQSDGLTVILPLSLLHRVRAKDFEKLVPGLREELLIALFRTLPKPIRKHVLPARQWAQTILAEWAGVFEDTSRRCALSDLLVEQIRVIAGVAPERIVFDWEQIPPHLRPNFSVVDEDGHVLARGKDLPFLQERFAHTRTEEENEEMFCAGSEEMTAAEEAEEPIDAEEHAQLLEQLRAHFNGR